MAKILGYQVATNTTVYKETDVREIEQMFEYFSSLEVDAHTISPGYEYDAAKKDMIKRLGKRPEDFFLTREMTREKFKDMEKWGDRFTIIGTRVYQEFLAGQARIDLHGLGHSHAQCPRLEGALLFDDRRPLCRLPRDAGESGLEQVRRGGRGGARSALRELHGPLRLRSERGARAATRGTTGKTCPTISAPSPSPITRAEPSRPSTAFPSARAIWPRPRRPSTPRPGLRNGRFDAAG